LDDRSWDGASTEMEALSKHFQSTPAYHLMRARLEESRGKLDRAVEAYRAASAGSTSYACNACQHIESDWRAHCTHCGRWDSFRGAVELVNV
jgi:hypothetical protein